MTKKNLIFGISFTLNICPAGFGDVSKDCSGTELEQWSALLQEWDKDNPLNFPRHLPALTWKGVPEALRGEVGPNAVHK